MKIGIFSDIHGNIYAFEKVYKKLIAEKCDQYIFCGDICGYYYAQNDIVEMLSGFKNLISVVGNHDRKFLECLSDEELLHDYSRKYGKSFIELKENISMDSLRFLESLPEKYIDESHSFAVFHGSPWNNLNEYIYPTDSIDKFSQLPYSYVILGHTHYPLDKSINDVQIINSGSCGQPRDCSDPSYAILDLVSSKVEIKRVTYSPRALIRDVKHHNEKNPYLIDVLQKR